VVQNGLYAVKAALQKTVLKCSHLTSPPGKDSSAAFSSTPLSHLSFEQTPRVVQE